MYIYLQVQSEFHSSSLSADAVIMFKSDYYEMEHIHVLPNHSRLVEGLSYNDQGSLQPGIPTQIGVVLIYF